MEREWRCMRCKRLLGLFKGKRLHIRFARGHQYLVSFPATSVCRGCRTLNEVPSPKQEDEARVTRAKAQG